MDNERWLLPEGIEEVLPHRAWPLEQLRRDLLDLYQSWGYELIMPPLIEFLESLLTGADRDLELQTFKLTDQLTGRLMGVRADMTPQAARIDAHQLRRDVPTRLCYLGSVLHTRPDGFAGSRSPLQTGAELFGHAGIESDVESICLMMETLRCSGLQDVYLDLGHVGIFRGLARQAGLDPSQEQALFDVLQRKAIPEIGMLAQRFNMAERDADLFMALAELSGDDALVQARTRLAGAGDEVQQALGYLQQVAAVLQQRLPEVPVHFDLGELRCYHYQTGVVFAAFVAGQGQEIARGGRYDAIGQSFGRARPATGFSTDLMTLLRLGSRRAAAPAGVRPSVFAPASDEPMLQRRVAELRAQGQRVVCALPGQSGGAKEMGCTHVLERQGETWAIRPV